MRLGITSPAVSRREKASAARIAIGYSSGAPSALAARASQRNCAPPRVS